VSVGRTDKPGLAGRWWGRLVACDAGACWLAALLALAGFAAIYLFAVWTTPGQWLDGRGFMYADRVVPKLAEGLLPWFVRVALPLLLALLAVVLGVAALVRRSWRSLTSAVLVVGVSIPAAWWLKFHLLWVPDGGDLRPYEQGTYPGVHMAAVTALVVAVLLLWPSSPSLMHLVVGALVVAATCLGNVVGMAHVPSDVIGAVLLVAAVTAGVLGVVRPCGSDSRQPSGAE
jgi:hypothetical protein